MMTAIAVPWMQPIHRCRIFAKISDRSGDVVQNRIEATLMPSIAGTRLSVSQKRSGLRFHFVH